MTILNVSKENGKYRLDDYSYRGTWSQFGLEAGWCIADAIGGACDAVGCVQKTLGVSSFLSRRSQSNLIKGMSVLSDGYDWAYFITTTPFKVWEHLSNLVQCKNKIDSFAGLLSEASIACGAIRLFHRIEAVDLKHLINGIETFKYTTGMLGCVLRIISTMLWMKKNEALFDPNAQLKASDQAKLAAKKASIWYDSALGVLFSALLISKRFKMTPYVMVVAGLATSITCAVWYFKNARSNHEEAKRVWAKVAPAA